MRLSNLALVAKVFDRTQQFFKNFNPLIKCYSIALSVKSESPKMDKES